MLLGKRLPPYGQNAERAKAWGMACMRPSERSLSHDIAQERAVKMAEELAAAAAQAPGRLSVCARVPLQHALAAGRLGRASSSNVSRRSWDRNSHGVLGCWSVTGYIRVRRARGAFGRDVCCAFLDPSSVIPNS